MADGTRASDEVRTETGRRWLSAWRGPWSPRDLLLLSLCPFLFVATALGSERLQSVGYVLPGVSLDSVDVSGFAPQVLDLAIERVANTARQHTVKARVGSAVFRISGADLSAQIAPDTRAQVLSAGRTGNLLRQVLWRFERFSGPDEYRSKLVLDQNSVEEHLVAFERAALAIPREGSVTYEEGQVRLVYPEPGETIDRQKASALLLEAIDSRLGGVELPTRRWSPTTTPEAVDYAAARFERAMRGPVELFVRSPPPEDPADLAAFEARLEEENDPERVERIQPEVFASSLATRQKPDAPSELEIYLRPTLLEPTLREVRERWERPAQDAIFNVDNQHAITVEPSKAQWVLSTEHAAQALLDAAFSDERRGVWELAVGEQPRITTQKAHSLNIHKLVGRFVTRHPCCRPRVKNIHRIADMLDGTVVLPGESFSVNETLGPRTMAMGFEPAPTIVRGEIDDTVGGGISQFATTFFNAVLRAGYEIIERQPHSYYFPRYPVGHEATLSYPKPDFIFRNDTQSGLLVKTRYTQTSIHVLIYGDNEGRVVTTEVSKPFDHVEPEVEYLADDTLQPGEEKIEQRGERGFTVYASRTVLEADGRERTEKRKVIYNPRPERILVHSCQLPEEAEEYTGQPCPELDLSDAGPMLSEVVVE